MPKIMYCWRCQTDIPMLTEPEWEDVYKFLYPNFDPEAALYRYESITGFKETNVNAIWHHRASSFGPTCNNCKKPLRTPKANFCAECGADK